VDHAVSFYPWGAVASTQACQPDMTQHQLREKHTKMHSKAPSVLAQVPIGNAGGACTRRSLAAKRSITSLNISSSFSFCGMCSSLPWHRTHS